MTDDDLSEFFGDQTIKDTVEEFWNEVFEASRKLIRDTKRFSFSEVEILPNPTVHQMLSTLSALDNMFEIALSPTNAKLETELIRLIFNARQQILNMELIATALNNKDRDNYDYAVRRLQNQAIF